MLREMISTMVVVSLLWGCDDAVTSPTAIEVLASRSGATTNHTRFSTGPTPVVGSIVCTGEAITGERTSKGHYQSTANPRGRRVSYHSQYQLRLVGVTGRRYTGQGTFNQTFHLSPGEVFHARTHNKLIAQGEDGDGDDFHAYLTYRFQLTPDGELQHSIWAQRFECR